jgi:hypothetical protein
VLAGDKTSEIRLLNTDTSRARKDVVLEKGATASATSR